jgi:hypothetical protein
MMNFILKFQIKRWKKEWSGDCDTYGRIKQMRMPKMEKKKRLQGPLFMGEI